MTVEDSKSITLEAGEGDSDTWVWNVASDAEVGTYEATIKSEDDEDTVLIDVASRKLITGFEDGDLTEFSGDTGSFDVNQNAPVYDGNYSLKCQLSGGNNVGIISASGDGLNYYPTRGDKIEAYVRAQDAENFNGLFAYGTGGTSRSDFTGYVFVIDTASLFNNDFVVRRYDSGSSNTLASGGSSAQDVWYKFEIFSNSTDFRFRAINQSTGATDADFTVTDNNHTGGERLGFKGRGASAFDLVEAIPNEGLP